MIARTWTVARSILIIAAVVLTIDALPLAANGINLDSLLKALIAIPVALAIVYKNRARRTVGLVLVAVLFVLLISLAASGIPQNDGACNTTVLSLLAVAVWMCVPRLESLASYAGVRRRAGVLRLPRQKGEPRTRSIRAVTIVGVFALVAIVAYASRLDDLSTIDSYGRIDALRVLDGLVGSAAVFVLARRMGGTVGAIAAAILWYCCGMRLDYTALRATDVLPTALVPLLAASAAFLRSRAVPAPLVICSSAILAGAIAIEWPLLAIVAYLATSIFSMAGDERPSDGWFAAGCGLAFLLVLEALYFGTIVDKVGLQTSLSDLDGVVAACSSGCDGGFPWEFVYPVPSAGAFSHLLQTLLTQTFHWGNYRANAIAPGWAELVLASLGVVALYREKKFRAVRIFAIGIVLGIGLSLPSHYLGLTLPSFTRVVTAVAPTFQFGAQCSLVSGMLVALLGGIGIARTSTHGSSRLRRSGVFVILALAVFESASFAVPGHAGAVLRALAGEIPRSDATRPKVAFYPFITDVDGPEFVDLKRSADRSGIDLYNAASVSNTDDLSDPAVVDRLKSQGVRYIVVSLDDYSRRRAILRNARLLLPNDRETQSRAWTPPTPERMVSFRSLKVGRDGSFLIAI